LTNNSYFCYNIHITIKKGFKMKQHILSIAVAAALVTLAGCSTTAVTNTDEQIRNQRLSTKFVGEGIKIETNCSWYRPFKSDCEIVSIEAVGTAPTFGNTTSNRKNALIRAEMQAGANVSHFIKQNITSSRVTTTIAKNVEKAQDKLSTSHGGHEAVEMSDTEAAAAGNVSVRENSNNTAVNLTTTIRANSAAVLRGFKVTRQEVTGPQEVAVTIRWDKDSERTARMLESKFGTAR
jgi:hypothetical protein